MLGPHKGSLVCSVLRTIDVLILVSGAFLSFAVPRGAIDADVEDCNAAERRESK